MKLMDLFNGYIVLGKYPQGANGEVKPIEWKILDIKDDAALVVSRCALSTGRYDRGSDKYVPWESCSLRRWMNYPFFNGAFSEEEKEIILCSLVCNGIDQGNPAFGRSGGADTSDRIFLLSYAEAEKLFSSDGDRLCIPTPYAIRLGAYADEDTQGGEAWLRSPGNDDYSVSVISPYGNLSCDGPDGSMSVVRPAMRIRING